MQLLTELTQQYRLEGQTNEAVVIPLLLKHAAEATIMTLQNELEGLCHAIKKQSAKRDATAGDHDICVVSVPRQQQVLENGICMVAWGGVLPVLGTGSWCVALGLGPYV